MICFLQIGTIKEIEVEILRKCHRTSKLKLKDVENENNFLEGNFLLLIIIHFDRKGSELYLWRRNRGFIRFN